MHMVSFWFVLLWFQYSDIIMSMMASQITCVSIVYSTICSGTDQRKHQSLASLAFVRGIHRWQDKAPIMRKMFSFDDVIMLLVFRDWCIIYTCILQGGFTATRAIITLHWRHNDHKGISNHQPHHCLLNHLFRRRSKKTSKLRVTSLCVGNSPGTGEFPAQMASKGKNVFIWWRHHVKKRGFVHSDDIFTCVLQDFFTASGGSHIINITQKSLVNPSNLLEFQTNFKYKI